MRDKITQFLTDMRQVCHRVGRDPYDITICFATKYLASEQLVLFLEILKDIHYGNVMIGENRVQDAEEKLLFLKKMHPDLFSRVMPVFIGTLQKNKINKAIDLFAEIHSVDSINLAQDIDIRAKREGKKIPIYLEMNVSQEPTKHGISIESTDQSISAIKQLNNITITGLMTMAPRMSDPESVRPIFRTLRMMADRYNLKTSMGMSSDWRIAIEERTDIIRIGSAVFD